MNNAPKKHILIISQYFHPESFRINDIATEWVKRGYQVTVLTGIPNYPQGRFYEGYGIRKKRRENWKGIRIIRIPLIPRGKSSIGLIANYFSFMLSGVLWVMTHRINVDMIFSFETSPMTQVMIGCRARNRYKVPHFLYVQDLWPENVEIVAGIHSSLIINPINKMVDHIYRNTDHIFATSPSFVEAIANRKVRVPKRKIHYWPQYAEDFYRPLDREQVRREAKRNSPVSLVPDDDSFKIIFTGNIGVAQGLDVLPRTAALIKGNKQQQHRQTRFIIVGDGRYRNQFKKDIKENDVEEMFTMIPRQEPKEIPELLACCDAAFVSFMDNELFRRTIPAKLQSYMASGMPILASAGGETERIVSEAECGICCVAGDENELGDAIIRLESLDVEDLKIKGTRAAAYAEKHFNRSLLMTEMDRIITGVIGERATHLKTNVNSKIIDRQEYLCYTENEA